LDKEKAFRINLKFIRACDRHKSFEKGGGDESMSSKTIPRAYELLAILLMITVSVMGLTFQGTPHSGDSGASGQFVPMASAMEEPQILEKEVGQLVHFKAKIKNNGNKETTYVIVVKWREDGTEEWESGGLEDLRLAPEHMETMIIGGVECTESMAGKYFDVKFILYEAETETALDEKEIDRAWYVKEIVVLGTIYGFWIE
jgi:hypothetical protein